MNVRPILVNESEKGPFSVRTRVVVEDEIKDFDEAWLKAQKLLEFMDDVLVPFSDEPIVVDVLDKDGDIVRSAFSERRGEGSGIPE